MAKEAKPVMLDVNNAERLTHLGQDALSILKQFGVQRFYGLSQEALKLAALETVEQIARRKQGWVDIDAIITDLQGTTQPHQQTQTQHLQHVSALYKEAAGEQAQHVKPHDIFAARDAAFRFATMYWRYPAGSTSEVGKHLKSSLRRSGAKFTLLGKITSSVESHLPRRALTMIASRRAA